VSDDEHAGTLLQCCWRRTNYNDSAKLWRRHWHCVPYSATYRIERALFIRWSRLRAQFITWSWPLPTTDYLGFPKRPLRTLVLNRSFVIFCWQFLDVVGGVGCVMAPLHCVSGRRLSCSSVNAWNWLLGCRCALWFSTRSKPSRLPTRIHVFVNSAVWREHVRLGH